MTDTPSDWPLGRSTATAVDDPHEKRRERSMGSLVTLYAERCWSAMARNQS